MESKLVKQIIVIRKDLKMRRGKEIAQGSHASGAVLLNLIRSQQQNNQIGSYENNKYNVSFNFNNPALFDWMNGHFRKIVVTVNSEKELLDLYEKAKSNNLLCALIEDSGFTEFNNKKTLTALAIGPAYADEIDPITKDLILY